MIYTGGKTTTGEKAIRELEEAVETWDDKLMRRSLAEALDQGLSPDVLISEGLAKGMDVISSRFNKGEIYLPQVMAASKVMESAMNIIADRVPDVDTKYRGVVVMATVSGDIHEIGKNVCITMLRGARYNVVDMGPDVSPERFVEAVRTYSPDVVGASALMTTTLEVQRRVVDAMNEFGCKPILVFGGAPCTQEWVDSINGDGYSASGRDMVLLVNRLIEEHRSSGKSS